MSIQQMKDEARALSPSERRELIGYLIAIGRERADSPLPPGDRCAGFLAWEERPRPRVGLSEAGRDTIYED